MGLRIRVPLRVLLPCLAVGLVGVGVVVIGVAEVSGMRGYLVRQADTDLLGCAKTMLMPGFAAVPGSGAVSGHGTCGMELLSDSGQVLIASAPASGRPAIPARGSWLAAHLAQHVTVAGTGGPWSVSVEPVRYRPQRIVFVYGADDVEYLIGPRAGPGISGMLVVMAPLPGTGRLTARYAAVAAAVLALLSLAGFALSRALRRSLRAQARKSFGTALAGISERMQASRTAEAMARLSAGEMAAHLAGASLRLRTSASLVRGFAQAQLQRGGPPPAGLDRMMRRAADEAARMAAVIEGLGADQSREDLPLGNLPSLLPRLTVPDRRRRRRLGAQPRRRALRSLWLGRSAPVVQADGPQVGRDCDADAPGDGGDGVAADGGAGKQSAHGAGDGGERLVFSELAQARRHGGRGHEAAAEEQQQEQDHRGVAGGLDALGGKPERDRQPGQREGEQGQYPDRAEPVQRAQTSRSLPPRHRVRPTMSYASTRQLVITLVALRNIRGIKHGAPAWKTRGAALRRVPEPPVRPTPETRPITDMPDEDVRAYREQAEATRDEPLSGSAARPGLTRAKVLSVRLNPDEFAELTAYADRLDVPASALVRGWILSDLRPGADTSPAAVVDRIAREVEQLRQQLAG